MAVELCIDFTLFPHQASRGAVGTNSLQTTTRVKLDNFSADLATQISSMPTFSFGIHSRGDFIHVFIGLEMLSSEIDMAQSEICHLVDV